MIHFVRIPNILLLMIGVGILCGGAYAVVYGGRFFATLYWYQPWALAILGFGILSSLIGMVVFKKKLQKFLMLLLFCASAAISYAAFSHTVQTIFPQEYELARLSKESAFWDEVAPKEMQMQVDGLLAAYGVTSTNLRNFLSVKTNPVSFKNKPLWLHVTEDMKRIKDYVSGCEIEGSSIGREPRDIKDDPECNTAEGIKRNTSVDNKN